MPKKPKPITDRTRVGMQLVVRTARRELRVPPGDLLSLHEAAERCGVPAMAFVDAIEDGRLKAIEVMPPPGKREDALRSYLRVRYLIPVEELVGFVRELDEAVCRMTGVEPKFELQEVAI